MRGSFVENKPFALNTRQGLDANVLQRGTPRAWIDKIYHFGFGEDKDTKGNGRNLSVLFSWGSSGGSCVQWHVVVRSMKTAKSSSRSVTCRTTLGSRSARMSHTFICSACLRIEHYNICLRNFSFADSGKPLLPPTVSGTQQGFRSPWTLWDCFSAENNALVDECRRGHFGRDLDHFWNP